MMEDFKTKIIPGIAHWKHPNFFAYYPPGNALENIYGDMLSTICGGVGFSWVT